MRLDDYLSTVGIIKRRTIAKELASNGMVTVEGRKVKAAYQVRLNDIIEIRGKRSFKAEVLEIPSGSVPKDERARYFKELPVS